jgi:copper resistance protein B
MRSTVATACVLGWLGGAAAQPAHDEHPPPAAESPQTPDLRSSGHADHASDAAPATEISAAERTAAFPDLSDMRMNDMMLENPLNKLVLLDRLESRNASGGDVLHWDLDAWIGRDLRKVWIRSEGARRDAGTERAELEVLWGQAVTPWWEIVAGIRADFAPGRGQEWAAVGIRGLAPYALDVEATAYVGSGGRTALRVEVAHELLVTNRLILAPSLELDWHGRTDPSRAQGSGLADAELGLRLRYEVRREVAPYVGLVRERRFGRTADFARAMNRDPDDTRFVAGIRLWF